MDFAQSGWNSSGNEELKFVAVEWKPEKRPLCPVCHARPHRQGNRWECPSCGKNWRKKYLRSPVDYSTRPKCPRCNAQHATRNKHAGQWECGDCGKQWSEGTREMEGRTQAILVLAKVNPTMTQKEIARLVGCGRPNVSLILKNHNLSEVKNG